MRLLALVAALMALLCCAVPVSVRNTPERPVPTAPMGNTVQQEDGTTAMNPQLGGPPQASDYQDSGFAWGTAISQALTGNWTGLAGTIAAALAGGGMIHQRRRRQRAEADRDRLAELPPDEAKRELHAIKRT